MPLAHRLQLCDIKATNVQDPGSNATLIDRHSVQ